MAAPAMVVRIAANLSELKKNLAEGKNQIETTTAAMQKLATSFQGDKLIQSAHNVVAAVNQLGGAAKLTEAEQARVNATLQKALDKYRVLGKEAPASMVALEAATRRVEAPTEGLSTKMVALGSFIGNMAANAVSALAGMAMNGVKALASGIGELVMTGGSLSAITQSFESLARGVNTTGDAMLGAMRTGTKGLVADMGLMQAANKAMLLGLPVTAKEMGTLAATATILGRAMGQGATKSFDDLITALGRSSPMILDNLGLSVKVGEANETYAKALKKTADELTDAEKKTAFYNAAMEAARLKVAELGEAHATLGDAISRAGVWWENFKSDLGVAIARSPVLNTALSEMGKAFAETFGASNNDRVKNLTALVNDLAFKLMSLADVALTSGKIIVQGFQLVNGTLQGVGSAVLNVMNLVTRAQASVNETMASIPVIGKQWEEAAVRARATADFVDALAQGYKRASDAAFESAGTQGAAFDAARARLAQMRTAMEAAAVSTVQHTEVTIQNTAAVGRSAAEQAKLVAGMVVKEGNINSLQQAVGFMAQATENWNEKMRFTSKVVDEIAPKLKHVEEGAQKAGQAMHEITSSKGSVQINTAGITVGNMEASFRQFSQLFSKSSIGAIGGGPAPDFLSWALRNGFATRGNPEARADGGPVSAGRPYLVGERGPEMFMPRTSGTVIPSGGGNVSVPITINGSVLSNPHEIARVVGDAVMQAMRNQGGRMPVGA